MTPEDLAHAARFKVWATVDYQNDVWRRVQAIGTLDLDGVGKVCFKDGGWICRAAVCEAICMGQERFYIVFFGVGGSLVTQFCTNKRFQGLDAAIMYTTLTNPF